MSELSVNSEQGLNILIKRARNAGYGVHHGESLYGYVIKDYEEAIVFFTTIHEDMSGRKMVREVWRRWFKHRWENQTGGGR